VQLAGQPRATAACNGQSSPIDMQLLDRCNVSQHRLPSNANAPNTCVNALLTAATVISSGRINIAGSLRALSMQASSEVTAMFGKYIFLLFCHFGTFSR
jgi:hypothetical protein